MSPSPSEPCASPRCHEAFGGGTGDNRNVDRAGHIQDVLRIGCGFGRCAVAPRGYHASENNVRGVRDVTERKCVVDATVGIDKNVSQTDPRIV